MSRTRNRPDKFIPDDNVLLLPDDYSIDTISDISSLLGGMDLDNENDDLYEIMRHGEESDDEWLPCKY